MNLLSNLDYQELHETFLNDVWGYVDQEGNEYALVGTQNGVSIVDVSNPSNPQEVFWVEGQQSPWRDLHVYGQKAYVTTEAEDGLLIIDLSPLPNGEITETQHFFGHPGKSWQTAHNLWIDEQGFCYIFGANRGVGGAIIYDLNSDPWEPDEVGFFDEWYVHDGYVRNDTMFLALIYEGTFSIVDVSDKSNLIILGSQSTPSSFTHNIWPSDNGKHVFTTDEVSGGYLGAYNIENINNIPEKDRIKVLPSEGIVPHNTHFLDDYLITSYYAAGVTVHDVSDPSNMVEVGRFDTYPGNSTFTIGCWGAYPYLPSGIVLASDIENGLFILQPNYFRAARIQGIITDAETGSLIQGVYSEVENHDQINYSTLQGNYKNGIAESATRKVYFYKYGYEEKEIDVDFQLDETIERDITLAPIPSFPLTITVKSATNGNPLLNASVRLVYNDTIELEQQTNGLGEVNYDLFYSDKYELFVGKWGHKTTCQQLEIDSNTLILEIFLEDGYYDDFTFDFGWTTFGTAEQGHWERAIPIGAFSAGTWANPNTDSPLDCGDYAYVTGNSANPDINVTEGNVVLVSPSFDATNLEDPHVYYERWFFNFHGPHPPNDTLRIFLNNGFETVEVDKQGKDPDLFGKWVPISIPIQTFLTPTENMFIRIETSDEFITRNIVQAGFDHFQLTEGSVLEISNAVNSELVIYPNPFDEQLTLKGLKKNETINVTTAQGKIILQFKTEETTTTISTTHFPKGIYFIQTEGGVKKMIKH